MPIEGLTIGAFVKLKVAASMDALIDAPLGPVLPVGPFFPFFPRGPVGPFFPLHF